MGSSSSVLVIGAGSVDVYVVCGGGEVGSQVGRSPVAHDYFTVISREITGIQIKESLFQDNNMEAEAIMGRNLG